MIAYVNIKRYVWTCTFCSCTHSFFAVRLSFSLSLFHTHTHTHTQNVCWFWPVPPLELREEMAAQRLLYDHRKLKPKLNLHSCRCMHVFVCIHACSRLWSNLLVGLLCIYNRCIQVCEFLWISWQQRSNFHELLAVTGRLSETQTHTHTLT